MKEQGKQPRRKPEQAGLDDRGYLDESRTAGMSVVAILPLVVLYQVGIVQSGSNVRNLAEVWLTGPFSLLGVNASTVVNVVLIVGLVIALLRVESRGTVWMSFLFVLVLEATFYAVLMFLATPRAAREVCRHIPAALIVGDVAWPNLWLCVGAGVYEELLFRLLLLGGGAFVLRKVFEFDRRSSAVVMLVISSALFSAAHHVGSMGEPLNAFIFVFRCLCGVALGTLFLLRGLGVAVWTHAIFNVLVLLYVPAMQASGTPPA